MDVVAQKGEGLAAGLTSVFAHFAARAGTALLLSTATARICRLRFLKARSRRSAQHDVVVGTDTRRRLLSGRGQGCPSSAFRWRRHGHEKRAGGPAGSGSRTAAFRWLHGSLLRHRRGGRLDSAGRGIAASLRPGRHERRPGWKSGGDAVAGCGQARESCEAHAIRQALWARRRLAGGAGESAARNFSDRGGPSFMVPLALAGIAYLLAIREFFSTPRFPARHCRRARVGCRVASSISAEAARRR